MLPKDPIMLLSVVNMKLRDRYASLEQLCEDMDVARVDIERALSEVGYAYNPATNQFV